MCCSEIIVNCITKIKDKQIKPLNQSTCLHKGCILMIFFFFFFFFFFFGGGGQDFMCYQDFMCLKWPNQMTFSLLSVCCHLDILSTCK